MNFFSKRLLSPISTVLRTSMNSRHIWSKAVIITEAGEPSEVARVYNVNLGELPKNKVLIKMLVAPINPSDKNQIQGVYGVKKDVQEYSVLDSADQLDSGASTTISGFVPGNEGVGVISEIGSEAGNAVNGPLKVGDIVVPVKYNSLGSWNNYIVAEPNLFAVIRDTESLTPEHIGSIKVNASTAYRMLKDIVSLKPGDVVIQNGANSGAGQILIQLAHLWGYKTINVVRDRPDFSTLEKSLLDLGADVVIKENELGDPNIIKSSLEKL
ncbi:hypothetical protein BB560_006914, partial [Smittium megazygosporum]